MKKTKKSVPCLELGARPCHQNEVFAPSQSSGDPEGAPGALEALAESRLKTCMRRKRSARREALALLLQRVPEMVNLTVYGQTDIGLVRKTNEDAFVVADLTSGKVLREQTMVSFDVGERGVLLAVSDGMGGASAGEVASAMVVESMRRSMTMGPSTDQSTKLVEHAAERANHEVWTAAHLPGRTGMGATLTALYLHGTAVHIAEVGDSRAYVLRAGNLVQVTRDQSFVQHLVDSGAMTPDEAAIAPLRNVITQAMGQKKDVSVALGQLELRERDCFLLCSDGLSNMVSADEMRHVILAAPSLDAACRTLIELAKQRGGDDNITVLIGGVSGGLAPLVRGETIADTLEIVQEAQTPLGAHGNGTV